MIKRYSIATIEEVTSMLRVPPTTGNTLLKGRLVSKTVTIQRDLGDCILDYKYRLRSRTIGQLSSTHFQEMLGLRDDIENVSVYAVRTANEALGSCGVIDYSLVEEAVQLKAKTPYSYHPRSPIPTYQLVNDKFGVWCIVFDS